MSYKRLFWGILVLFLLVISTGWLLYTRGNEQVIGIVAKVRMSTQKMIPSLNSGPSGLSCIGDECLEIKGLTYPAGVLPQPVGRILIEALVVEHKALAVYERALADYGPVRPFIMVIRSKSQQISVIESLFDKYGLVPPFNDWRGVVEPSSSIVVACQQAVEMERELAVLIEQRLLQVKDYPDIANALRTIKISATERYIPAFQECGGMQ